MQYRSIPRTDLEVSLIGLGTMTWGQQNSEEEAHAQLDYAVGERGINFIDTAEMYPVPGKRKTQGRTEEYIGSWLKARGRRVSRRCFVASATKLILPAYGALTGGLDAAHPEIVKKVGVGAEALVPVSDRLLRFPIAA